jgi:hypothetical protein
MTLATISWPEASVYVTAIAAAALILAVLIWSIFRTGQAAIRSDTRQREFADDLPRDVDELRAQLRSSRAAATEQPDPAR